jgi:hypothetical protein
MLSITRREVIKKAVATGIGAAANSLLDLATQASQSQEKNGSGIDFFPPGFKELQ